MKYFANFDMDEMVYSLDTWIERLNEKHGDYESDSIKLELCKREIGGEMWCTEEGEFVERGEYGSCGKQCANYKPCNGKSGRCRNLYNGFEGTGEFYILAKDGKLTKEVVNANR